MSPHDLGCALRAGSAAWHVLNYCAPSILIAEKNLSPHPSLPPSHIHSESGQQHSHGYIPSLLVATPFFSFHAGRPCNFIPRQQHVSVIAFDVPPMSRRTASLPIEEHFPPARTKNASLFCFESHPPINFDSQACKVSARSGDYVVLLSC